MTKTFEITCFNTGNNFFYIKWFLPVIKQDTSGIFKEFDFEGLCFEHQNELQQAIHALLFIFGNWHQKWTKPFHICLMKNMLYNPLFQFGFDLYIYKELKPNQLMIVWNTIAHLLSSTVGIIPIFDEKGLGRINITIVLFISMGFYFIRCFHY